MQGYVFYILTYIAFIPQAQPYLFTSKNSPSSSSKTASKLQANRSSQHDAAQNCEICTSSNHLDDWVIALLCVLAAAVLIQTVFIAVLLNKKADKSSGKKVLIE